MPLDIDVDHNRLVEMCRRYHVAKLELFGSRVRGSACPDSDVDLLVTFEPGMAIGLEFFGLGMELEDLLHHRVDLLTRPRVERDPNPIFRDSVLGSVEVLYAA